MSKKQFSFSTLSTICDKNLWNQLTGKKIETVFDERALEGKAVHDELYACLETQDWEEWDKKRGSHPKVFDQKGWEYETEFTYEIEYDVTIKGFIDLILVKENKMLLLDIKNKNGGTLSLTQKQTKQLKYYVLATLIKNAELTVTAGIFIASLSKYSNNPVMLGDFDNTKIEGLEKYITKDVKRATNLMTQQDVWKTTPSFDCAFCKYSLSCETIPHYDKDNIPELIEEYAKLSGKLKAVENILKVHCHGTGEIVRGAGLQCGYFDKTKMDKNGLYDYCLAKKIPIKDLFMPNFQAYRAACSKNEELAQFSEIELEFKIKKDNEEEEK